MAGLRNYDFHLSPPRDYFLPSVSLGEVVRMKEGHLASEKRSHELMSQQDALSRARSERAAAYLKETNTQLHEQAEKVNRRIEAVVAVEPRLSENMKRLERRCEELGQELLADKHETVEARRDLTELQAEIEAEVATKKALEREVSSKESLRRRLIEKDVAGRRGDLERRKSQVRHERANVHQIDRRAQGLAKTDVNLSSLSTTSMRSCLEKARKEFPFLQSQLVELDLAWKRLPEERAKILAQSQEMCRISTKREELEELVELAGDSDDDDEDADSSELNAQDGSHVIVGDVFAVLRPPAREMVESL
ncbi:hypothetical protein FOL47_006934 [Perkinsus chesapeaki]|uniref:Uncharacterized protein n=1 Tax=Perkinsus chesapeaki TaxID=330153 RepID=A0A7J6LP95_PERCH|nr:hypothetical protein FOL47_006934 [Perkinsus chesapeaki]